MSTSTHSAMMCSADGCVYPAFHIASMLGVDASFCVGHFHLLQSVLPSSPEHQESTMPTPPVEEPLEPEAMEEPARLDLPAQDPGAEHRPSGRPSIPFNSDDLAFIATLHRQGTSSRSISRIMGVSHDTILRRLQSMKQENPEETPLTMPSDLPSLLSEFRIWSDRVNLGETKKRDGQRIVDAAKARLRTIHDAMKPFLE